MKDELKQGNALIAEFMGAVVQSDLTCKPYPNEIPRWAYVQCDFDTFKVGGYFYHTSWDWLMPVVEKIRDFKVQDGERITIRSSIHIHITNTGYEWHCSILGSITFCDTEQIPHNYTKIDVPHISLNGKTNRSQPIEPVYAAVVEFIKWYNTQSK